MFNVVNADLIVMTDRRRREIMKNKKDGAKNDVTLEEDVISGELQYLLTRN